MRSAGFTLVEIAIVTVILGILALMAAPRIQEARLRAQLPVLQSDLRRLVRLQEVYHGSHGQYTDGLEALNFEASPEVTVTVELAGGPDHAEGGGGGLEKKRGVGYSALAELEGAPVRCAVYSEEGKQMEPADRPRQIACETG